ncbi:MAG: hypothetical protein ACK5L5_07455 [Bacteroidales bacterium]
MGFDKMFKGHLIDKLGFDKIFEVHFIEKMDFDKMFERFFGACKTIGHKNHCIDNPFISNLLSRSTRGCLTARSHADPCLSACEQFGVRSCTFSPEGGNIII